MSSRASVLALTSALVLACACLTGCGKDSGDDSKGTTAALELPRHLEPQVPDPPPPSPSASGSLEPAAAGTEAPAAGTETPDAGTETPDAGTEAPAAGTE